MSVLDQLGDAKHLVYVMLSYDRELVFTRPDLYAILVGYGFYASNGKVPQKEGLSLCLNMMVQIEALGGLVLEVESVADRIAQVSINSDPRCLLH